MKELIHILIVDDDADFRNLVGLRLRVQGVITDIAKGGKQALQMAQRQKYDVVLLDQGMPDMSGIETLVELRKKFDKKSLKIIMLTAHNEPETVKEAIENGANSYFIKSDELSSLMDRINEHL